MILVSLISMIAKYKMLKILCFFFRPKFRSYKPQNENLKNNMLEDAKPGDVEAVVREQLDAASSKVVIEELVSCIYLFPHFLYLYKTDDKT